MRDVLIDVRCLQEPGFEATQIGLQALELVAAARESLPSDRLLGLVDPRLAALPAPVAAMLDTVRGPVTTGTMRHPTCLVQLSPLHDPLFVVRFLRHRSVASATVMLPELPPMEPIARAARLHWHARYGRVVDGAPPVAFWSAVASLRPGPAPAKLRGQRARVALIDSAPAAPFTEALADMVDLDVLRPAPDGLPDFAFRTPRFDRVVGVVENAPASAPVAKLIHRHGGACLIRDAGLLALYDADPAMAEAELGRALGPNEVARWRAGAVRPGALFLRTLVATADPIIVHSRGFAETIRQRFGREAIVIPRDVTPHDVDRGAARRRLGVDPDEMLLAAVVLSDLEENCLWALDLLRFWGVPARLHLIGPPPWNWPHLRALAHRLGIAGRIALMPQPLAALHWNAADLGLMLSVGANTRASTALLDATAHGVPCIAAESMALSVDVPGWVRVIPDEPSPVLLAEAISALREARPGAAAQRDYAAAHSPAAAAAALCTALAL